MGRYEDFLAAQRQPRRPINYDDGGGLALEGLVGHESGSPYDFDQPGYDPTGIEPVMPEQEEIATATQVKPKGMMENIANIFGNTPLQTQGQGIGGLIAAIASGVANYHVGKAGKNLEGRREVAKTEQTYARNKQAKDEDSRRLLQRETMIERVKQGMKKPEPTTTIDVAGYPMPLSSELGQSVVAKKAGITLRKPKDPKAPPKPSSTTSTLILGRADDRVKAAKDSFRRRYWSKLYKSPEEFAAFGNSPLPPEAEADLEADPAYRAAKSSYDGAYVTNVLRQASTLEDVEEAKAYLLGLPADARARILQDPAVVRAERAAQGRIQAGGAVE